MPSASAQSHGQFREQVPSAADSGFRVSQVLAYVYQYAYSRHSSTANRAARDELAPTTGVGQPSYCTVATTRRANHPREAGSHLLKPKPCICVCPREAQAPGICNFQVPGRQSFRVPAVSSRPPPDPLTLVGVFHQASPGAACPIKKNPVATSSDGVERDQRQSSRVLQAS